MSTTEEEAAFDIVKEILKPLIKSERLSLSDSKTYMGIILDKNSHRTICRIYLTPKGKFIGTISERKVETKMPIHSVYDISKFATDLLTAARYFDR